MSLGRGSIGIAVAFVIGSVVFRAGGVGLVAVFVLEGGGGCGVDEGLLSGQGGDLALHELLEGNGNTVELRGGVFSVENSRGLGEELGEVDENAGVDFLGPFLESGFLRRDIGDVENVAGEGERSPCHDRWTGTKELFVEKSNLEDVLSHRLCLLLIAGVVEAWERQLEEAVNGRVSNHPLEGLKYVPFHLDKHVFVVERAAHQLELMKGWNTVLLVAILGSDEEGGASDELVVTLVDYSL